MHVRRSATVLLAFAVVLPACRPGDASDADRATVRDSAGITIVETVRPAWSDSASAWTIDPRPTTEIGLVEGDLPYLLDRVEGATRLPDGRIVVANRGTNELRFFDAAGAFLQSAGGTGGGPGEFEYLRGLERCGADSLFAFDLNWQTKVFTADGAIVRQMVLLEPGSRRPPYQLACSPTGGFVISGWGISEGPPEVGFYRSMTAVWLLDADGDSLVSLGEHLGSERIGTPNGSGPHPFGRTTRFAIAADEVYLGDGSRFEVRRYSRDGRLIGIQRAPAEDLSITDALVSAYRDDMLERLPESRRPAFERELRDMPMPDGVPAFTDLRLDEAGYLWVQRFRVPGDTGDVWGIFAPDGVFLGHLTMPERLTVHEIGEDYVLGVATDDDGVQRVRVHALERRARGG